MPSEPQNTEASVDRLFSKIESLLIQTWQETGHGYLAIESEKISPKKIKVIIRGSTHYRYTIGGEDVKAWISKRLSEGE